MILKIVNWFEISRASQFEILDCSLFRIGF